jgi:glycosyltransferase involved in cell wall biosynthesis
MAESPLTITHVVRSDAFAGVERYVCEVANGLSGRGHHTKVIGGDPARMKVELAAEVSFTPAASTAQVWNKLARGGRVDLVHAHMTASELAAVMARPWHRAPIVSTRHFAKSRGRRWPTASVASMVGRRLARQIAISEFVAAGIGEDATVVYNGVANQPAAPLEQPRALMMQRLQPEKTPEVGLRAWAGSGLGERGWVLLVAGSGSLEGELRRQAADAGVGDTIVFLGQVRDTDALLDSASILLATAPAEPFGLAVAEAMAHGVPVVAAAGGAHGELLGESAFLFEPGDAVAAGEGVAQLAEDSELRRREGERLRERQRALFSLDGHLDRLEEIYRATIVGAESPAVAIRAKEPVA